MKVYGFTFIRNALKYDYPIVEAIRSILPICDKVIVGVGDSEDDTLSLIQDIDPKKIEIIQTVWDDSLREGGKVLAVETDKVFQCIPDDVDWAFYIQGDEVIHEKYLPEVKNAMTRYLNNHEVDGFLFKYLHFYGSYDYVGVSSNWYRHEIRVVRNSKNIYSYRDAQGFRKNDNEKLRVKPIDAYIYHYGWVREPASMQRKQETFKKYWHDDDWVEKNLVKADEFDYSSNITELTKFEGEHPEIMKNRLDRINWQFEMDISFKRKSLKDKVKVFFQKFLNIEIGYKNYKKI
jgi:hypothetical protein